LHYQLVKSNWIVNHTSAYKKLGSIVDDCKYAGVIDWDYIEDRGRVPYIPYYVKDVEDALNDTIAQYRIDRQIGQDVHIELWTEKDALSGIMKRSTEKYHIQLIVNKGYTSSSAIYRAYQRVLINLSKGRNVVILYFGDHDPSGLDMVRDIRERIIFMLENGNDKLANIGDGDFEVLPIGLTMEQIKKYKLPPNPTKLTDSRADKYIKKFGKTCWEVDALSPRTLTAIIETNIKKIINMKQFSKMIDEENEGLKELREFVESRN
jgi:hypothetical protein